MNGTDGESNDYRVPNVQLQDGADGRDLRYVDYSNNAIVQRSRFHGHSETAARQIVA